MLVNFNRTQTRIMQDGHVFYTDVLDAPTTDFIKHNGDMGLAYRSGGDVTVIPWSNIETIFLTDDELEDF